MECLLCQSEIKRNYNYVNLFNVKNNLICQNCSSKLERVTGGCRGCGKKTINTLCDDCIYWMNYENTNMFRMTNYSIYYYNEYAKDYVRQLKFIGNVRILLAFKEDIKLFFKKKFDKSYYLVPIPLHEERLQERGFNQSSVIAELTSYPIVDILKKRNNDKQSKKTRMERIVFDDNYYIEKEVNLTNKRVIIIDDIYTTGATVHKIGKLLFDVGVKDIISFTLFRS